MPVPTFLMISLVTTKGGDAYEVAKTLSLEFDVVASVSGDGLVHEILNGFAHHEHPTKAFDIPVAPIPTGSGNALACNIIGVENGVDVAAATLNLIKGEMLLR
jgi:sphingosine kinase